MRSGKLAISFGAAAPGANRQRRARPSPLAVMNSGRVGWNSALPISPAETGSIASRFVVRSQTRATPSVLTTRRWRPSGVKRAPARMSPPCWSAGCNARPEGTSQTRAMPSTPTVTNFFPSAENMVPSAFS